MTQPDRAELEASLLATKAAATELRRQLDNANAELAAIKGSTSWRLLLLLQRLRRVITWPVRRAGAIAAAAAAWLRRHNPFVTVPLDPDVIETCYEPRWDAGQQAWTLQPNPERLRQVRRAGTATAHSVAPYVVRSAVTLPAGVKRPLVMHVIPNVFVGGSTQLIIDLIEHLKERYEQEVITSALWHGGPHRGMTTHHFPLPLDEARLRELLARKAPALVHLHYWGLTDEPWYRAVLHALSELPCKVVENINTPIAPLWHPHVDHYVYVSEYVRRTFGGAAAASTVSSVIHPGIDLSLFDTPIAGEEPYDAIGMVYRLEPDKLREDSIQLLIEVVRRRPRTKAYVVGGGSLFRSYVAQTKAAGVRQNFHFTGYVPYETLPDWYRKFSIFVAPVWQESFGQVSVFAMNMKMAVAGYKIGALPEILGSDATFGATREEAAAKIVALLNDRPRLKALGEANRARAQAAFGVAAMTRRYGEIYDRLLAAR